MQMYKVRKFRHNGNYYEVNLQNRQLDLLHNTSSFLFEDIKFVSHVKNYSNFIFV